jgi:hypothetical protein
MKLRHVVTNAVRAPQITILPESSTRKRKGAPNPTEIYWRAFEIHIERGGIHVCDLDDWLRAECGLPEEFKDREREITQK